MWQGWAREGYWREPLLVPMDKSRQRHSGLWVMFMVCPMWKTALKEKIN